MWLQVAYWKWCNNIKEANPFVIELCIASCMQHEPQPVQWIWFELTFQKNLQRGLEVYSNVNTGKQT